MMTTANSQPQNLTPEQKDERLKSMGVKLPGAAGASSETTPVEAPEASPEAAPEATMEEQTTVTDVVGMDLSKDLGDFKSNVIALMSTVTGVVTTSDIKSTFNAKTKQYYAVKFEGLSSDDIDALNTNASSVFESSLSGSVDKISSKTGKIISVSDDNGMKTNANICRYVRQSIFPDGTIKPDRNTLKNMESGIGKLTGISGFKFANMNVGATQILFGYEKNADGTVSGEGRVQYVSSQAKQGSIVPGSFKIENNNIVLSKDLGMQNKAILEKLLGVTLNTAPKEPESVNKEASSDFTPGLSTTNVEAGETGNAPEETGNLEGQQEVIAGGKRKTKKRNRKSIKSYRKKHRKTAKKQRKSRK